MKRLMLLVIFCLSTLSLHAQLYSDSISVNFFLLDECRITQNMSGEINYIYQNYNEAPFTIKGYFPNVSTKEENIPEFMAHYSMIIPYFTDYDKENASFYEATIAPEVIVFDEKQQKTLYKGRIDNSYDKVGSRRRVITSKDLRLALDAIKNNQVIAQPLTQAVGCFINYNESN